MKNRLSGDAPLYTSPGGATRAVSAVALCAALWCSAPAPVSAQETVTHAPRTLAELPPVSEYERGTTYAPDGLPAQVLFSGGYKEDTWTETRFTVVRRIKIFDVEGLAYAAFEFRTRIYETVEAVEARVIHADGGSTRLDPEGAVTRTLTYAPLWGPEIVHRHQLPGVEPGEIVEYRYTLSTQLGPGLRFNYWYLQDWVSTVRTMYTLEMPGDFMPFTADTENISSSSLPDEEERDGRRLITWSFAEIPALEIEPYMPPPSFLKARLVVDYEWTASSASEPVAFWSQVGRAQALKQRRFMEGVPRTEAVVKELRLDKREIPERLGIIVEWVREHIVNRSAELPQEMAANEEPDWQESATADEVLERGEGTALEITRLAVTLLRAAGVDAYLGLAVSRETGVLRYTFLDPQQFDESFIAVRLPGDDVAFLQPSARYGPVRGISWRIQGALALICTPDRGFFARLPVDNAIDNRRSTVLELDLSADGVASGTIAIRYGGQESLSLKERLSGRDAADWQAWFQAWIRTSLPGTEISTVTLTDAADGLEARMRLSTARLVTRKGDEFLIDPAIFADPAPDPALWQQRRHPVYLPYPRQEDLTLRLKLPAGARVVLPGARKVDSDVGSLVSQWESGEGALIWRRNFIQDRIFFDRTEARRLATFLREVREAQERQQARIDPD